MERLDVEAHAGHCLRCARVLADLRATAVALDRAYAPFRGASVSLSPARCRLLARAPERGGSALRLTRLIARVSEVTLAAAVTAFAFAGAGSVVPERAVIGDEQTTDAPPLTHVTSRLDDATLVRWMRLDRYVPQEYLIDPTVDIRVTAVPVGGGGGGGR